MTLHKTENLKEEINNYFGAVLLLFLEKVSQGNKVL